MKRMIYLVVLLICFTKVSSQSLKKYPIGNSGCSAYFYCDPGLFSLSYSPDSAKVYNKECQEGESSYGVICIKLITAITDLNDAENVLVAYLDYLKPNFKIRSAAGYGKGLRLRGRDDTRGVLDYWKDEDNINYKIKGWTDGKCIAVMYVYSKKELQETKINVFLDGFLFQGM